MNVKTLARLAASSLVLGMTVVGCKPAGQGGINSASALAPASNAAKSAERARKALAENKLDEAVSFAEASVAAEPRNPAYRMLLGQSYLAAGRFASAETSFADTLSLDPGNPSATLNLALAQIGQGKHFQARALLQNPDVAIRDSDRGLALALAGDQDSATALLEKLARSDQATAQGRQNLAFTYAMQGRWREARIVASQDLSYDEVNKRLERWARLSQPRTVADQVAAMLGVVPAVDPGQPPQLALLPEAAPSVAIALDAPLPAEPVAASAMAPEPIEQAAPATPTAETIAMSAEEPPVAAAPVVADPVIADKSLQTVVFGPRQEIVQPLPASAQRVVASAADSMVQGLESGKYVVQLGAWNSEAEARAGWSRAVARSGKLAGYVPASSTFKQFHRVSVGGFASNADAQALCRAIQADGGRCFVRPVWGDRTASWAGGSGRQVASR